MKFSEEKTLAAINFLGAYKLEKNYRTDSDFASIQRWVMKALDERDMRNSSKQTPKIQKQESKKDDVYDGRYLKSVSDKDGKKHIWENGVLRVEEDSQRELEGIAMFDEIENQINKN